MIADQDAPQISILIVAYQSQDFIADCLRAIPPAAGEVAHEILLVDNGDGATEAVVRAGFPEVRIVPGEGNVGFARGNNLLADEAKGDFLLLLNPDMVLREGTISALIDGAERHPEASAWGAVTLGMDGEPDSANAIAIPSLREFVSLVLGRSIEGSGAIKGRNEDAPVRTLSGSCLLISRSAWEDADGLDERYFLYCEEVDFFHRLGRKGHSFWRIAGARGIHHSGHGESASPDRMLYKAAGTVQFLRLHWSRPKRAIGIMLLWIAAVERHVAGLLLGRWKPRLKRLGVAYRLVARRPDLWMGGYHEKRGLLAKLRDGKEGVR